MSRSIQVGDFVLVSLPGYSTSIHIIRQIDQSVIYISPDSDPETLSLIVPLGLGSGLGSGQGGWQVYGFHVNYQIEFIANPNILTQPTQSTLTKSIGTILTGELNVDILIFAQLDDQSLSNACQVDKYTASLCLNDMLWFQKVKNRYSGAEKFKITDKTWKKYYEELKKVNNDPD